MQSAEIYNPFDVIALEIFITLILPARKTIFNNREKVQNVFIKRWSSWSGENVAQIIFYVNLGKLTSAYSTFFCNYCKLSLTVCNESIFKNSTICSHVVAFFLHLWITFEF